MKIVTAASISFVATSILTFAVRWWPSEYRPGWFELEGRPVAIDGRPVEDWRHVNEILARYAVAAVGDKRPSFGPGHKDEEFVREFVLDFAPGDPGHVQRATVRQCQDTSGFFMGGMHPIGKARYTIVSVQPVGG